jgi:hypothetical protein
MVFSALSSEDLMNYSGLNSCRIAKTAWGPSLACLYKAFSFILARYLTGKN